MMQFRKYCALALLLVYVLGIVMPVEHDHLENVTGSGRVVLAQHEDAGHCRHIPVSDHNDCALCSTYNGRAIAAATLDPVPTLPLRNASFTLLEPYFHSLHFLSSQSHRGPPAFPV